MTNRHLQLPPILENNDEAASTDASTNNFPLSSPLDLPSPPTSLLRNGTMKETSGGDGALTSNLVGNTNGSGQENDILLFPDDSGELSSSSSSSPPPPPPPIVMRGTPLPVVVDSGDECCARGCKLFATCFCCGRWKNKNKNNRHDDDDDDDCCECCCECDYVDGCVCTIM
mmetsp:Transcript_5849/g.11956  ORF Transcript_5849/g.11956 Transcript_5849/m.11956 type:complete len:171 (-) Transcript_5849:392-904(-)